MLRPFCTAAGSPFDQEGDPLNLLFILAVALGGAVGSVARYLASGLEDYSGLTFHGAR